MRIKKLELLGFKSFKDKTVISFDEGITGIVGPNGCGKSNIVDALVWVMGEMSAKHLRGSSMDDVIFAGSQDYAPLGMAEVSLTLENDGGPFPVRYLNHSEVMVTRRLHRSGESEYLINKEPSRLRDIQEIFMDTGAGSKGFSIIEQGKIGQIITSKPHERRSIIEEAAGITKFKARKRESVRKLAATETNLTRLADIVRELKRQLDSLERQAQKAERYRKIKNELRDKEVWLSAIQVSGGQDSFSSVQDRITELTDKVSFYNTEIQSLQAQVEEERSKSLDKEKALEDEQVKFKAFSDKVMQAENEIRELEFEIEQTKRSQEIKSSVFEQNQAKLQVVQTEKEEVETRFMSVAEEFAEIEAVYTELEEQYSTHSAQLNEKESLLNESRKAMLELHQGISHIKVQSAGLEEKVKSLKEEHALKEEAKLEVKEKGREFEERFLSLNKDYESQKQMKLDLVKDKETLQENYKRVEEKLETLNSDREEESKAYSVATSKLSTLKELQDQFEGYQEGLRNLLLKKKNNSFSEPGLPLSELIRLPNEYEAAVESCLGDGLQALFGVSSIDQINSSLEFLNNEQGGRVQFFVEELLSSSLQNSQDMSLTSLADYLVNDDQALKNILSKFYLVESRTQALEILKLNHGFCLTKSGEMMSSLGHFYTGKTGEMASSGLVTRKRNIEELTTEVQQRKTALDGLNKEIDQTKKQITQLGEELEGAKQKDSEQEMRVFELKKDLEQAEHENRKAQAELEKADNQMSEIQVKITDTETKYEEFLFSIRDLEVKREEKEKMSLDAEESLESLKASYSGLQEEVTNKKVQFASLSKEKESLEARLESVKDREAVLLSEIGSLQEESESSTSNISSFSSDLELKRAQLERDLEVRAELEKQVSMMRDEYEQWTAKEREIQQMMTEHTFEKSKIDSELGDLQVKAEQKKMKLQNTIDQIFEKYEVDLTESASEYVDKYSPEEANQIEKDVSDLKGKVHRMGEVNLSAINEYDDIKTRYEFLTEQQRDLLNAKNQLEKVINRINRICSTRFRDTFEAVNERFKKVFPVLFGGGEARLILIETEGDDKEPGIDIEAKPPGKKAQNVSLLSGGEKALTAVSLIFSIFLVKPSPYCLLDEVDAPLDDANVFRFNDLVKEMAKRSQIILVTHNKNTMAVNNKLYGVTQEERGVSKMVSVDLDGNFLKEVSATA